MKTDLQIKINLSEVVAAIETTVSLVGIDDTNHGKRVGYIASQLGHELGYSQSDLHFLYQLGLLHDLGVSSDAVHQELVVNFDWGEANLHCEIGYQLLKDFEPLAHLAVPVLYHHTPWPQLAKLNVRPRDAQMANLIYIADRVDVLSAGHYGKDILVERERVLDEIKARANSNFNPAFVEVLERVARSESFWLALEDRHITRYAWDMNRDSEDFYLSMAELKQLSLIIAYIVDQKSTFTALHSVKVSELARFIAEAYGMTPLQCQKIEIAGLLHDIGKLHTPDAILNKPGVLDEHERAIMNQHSFETYEILRHISGIEDIALWAAFHHEGIDGHGYPFHPSELDLSTEARIIAVADVFQALVQNRPYREGLDVDEVLSILHKMTVSGRLDASIVSLVGKYSDQCFEIAGSEVEGRNNYKITATSGMLMA